VKKLALSFLIVGAVFAPSAFAYKDMTKPAQRARDLGMTTANYETSMSYAGVLTGFLFGLFLWKLQ
jgi:hypothetical protein